VTSTVTAEAGREAPGAADRRRAVRVSSAVTSAARPRIDLAGNLAELADVDAAAVAHPAVPVSGMGTNLLVLSSRP
jgi:hypothetical protein